jgi:hypothetical protein
MKEARIRVLTNEPDYSDYQDLEYDWSSSVYGDVKEIIPTDILEPEGKYITLSHYFDANLYHDMEDPLLPSSTSSIKPRWIGTQRNKLLSRLLLLVRNSLLRGLLSIRSSTSE